MTDHFRTQGPALLDNGYLIVPIRPGEKRPAISGWQKARLTHADVEQFPDHGVGVLCGQGDCPVVGVDIDISHPVVGPAVIAWCQQHLGFSAERVGAAPRILLAYRAEQAGWAKGLSVAFFDPADPVKPSGKKNEQRIEILGMGQQFVAYHEHPDTLRDYEWVDMMGGLAYLPASDLPVITAGQVAALLAETARIVAGTPGLETSGAAVDVNAVDLGDMSGDLMTLVPRVGKTLAEVQEIVGYLTNGDDDYDTWMHVGMALHHEFVHTPDEAAALVLWREYGSRSSKDEPAQYDYKWRSFGKQTSQPTTLRWLLKLDADRKVRLKYAARDEWAAALVSASDEFAVREKMCPKIAKDTRLDDMGREALAQALFEAFKRLGTKYPIAECRKLLVEKRAAKLNQKTDLPKWAQGWVYSTDDDQFFLPDSAEWLSLQGFNARFNRELPTDAEGALDKSASWTVLDEMEIPCVTRAVYLPWAGAMFDLEGVKCVNTYRPSSAPVAAAILTPGDREIVKRVVQHVELLAGGRPEVVATMIDWLAHNVQHPGVKIRWAPLWKGVEGDGKTVMGSLLASVMGRVNVRNVSPKVLGTDFTGWAEGAAVVVLEEIKLTGHNRYDILNALKPFITNDSIEIHSKGKDTREAINTVNYIAFTNYNDALPLVDTDRRWWIVFSPFFSQADMEQAVKHLATDLGAYFDALHDAIQQHPAVLRKWLLDHSISPSFKANGSAPMTDEKAVMIGMSSSDDEDAVRDILDNCEPSSVAGEAHGATRGVTPNLFSSRCMGDALVLSDMDVCLTGNTRNRLFSKVGFTKFPKKVKWNGDAHVVWVKGSKITEPDEIRKILDKTLPKNDHGGDLDNFSKKGSDMDDLF